MRAGIFLSAAALALSLFVVDEAHGWWHRGPDLDQQFSGSSLTIRVDEATGNTETMQNLIAKGRPGSAHLDIKTVFGPAGPDARCPGQFGADVVSQVWVETFADGSLLTGSAGPGGFLCTDGVVYAAEGVTGALTGGTGRFEGVSGTWEGNAVAVNGGMTGTVTADFD